MSSPWIVQSLQNPLPENETGIYLQYVEGSTTQEYHNRRLSRGFAYPYGRVFKPGLKTQVTAESFTMDNHYGPETKYLIRPKSLELCISLQGEPLPDKVFVEGLAEKVHYPVEPVKIITDKSLMSKNGEPRWYAFLQFQSVEDAKKVLEMYGGNSHEELTTLKIYDTCLNIGSAFKKTPTFGRVFGPGLVPQVMATDPYQMYHPYGPYAAYLAGPKSPLPAGLQGALQYYMPYGYGPQSPYIIQQQAPASPTLMRNGPYMTSGAGHLAGGTSPGGTHGMTTQMAYQLASSMLNHQSPVSPGVLTDLDCSYLNSSSSSSSRHGAADRSSDRFQYGPAPPLAQLPSGHVEQRERNGRAIHIPQPVRVAAGQSSTPYLNGSVSPGMTSDGYLAPGMRHQYVQH